MNPYSGEDFFGFFAALLHRMGLFFLGEGRGLFADELQCLVLLLLGISLAFLGVFLVLKQMTMVANALSHTLLLGLVLAFLFFHSFFSLEAPFSSIKALWIAAFITGGLTTFLVELLTQKGKVHEDASIAFVFTTLFALGVLLVAVFTRNMHLGMEALTGNIDVLHPLDLKILGGVTFIMVSSSFFLFRGLVTSAFDAVFAKSIGFPVRGLNYLLMILTAGVSIACFRAVGVLLFLAFLVGPVLIARLYTHSIQKLLVASFAISAFCSLFSVAFSRHILTVYKVPVSTSGLAVTTLFSLYLLALLGKMARNFFLRNKKECLKKFSP